MCGVMIARGCVRSGWSGGSGSTSVTSRATPPRAPESSATTAASAIDQRPARSVDDDRRSLHRRDQLGPDQVAGLVGEGSVQGHEIGISDGLRSAPDLRQPLQGLGQVRIVAHDLEAQGQRPLDHPAADPADPEQRQGSAAQPVQRSRDLPAALPHPTGAGDDAAGRRQQQRDGVVGDLVEAVVGDVGDPDPARRRDRDVDVVDPDPVAGDHRAAVVGGRFDNRRADRREADQHRVGRRGQVDQRVLVRGGGEDDFGAQGLERPPLDLEAVENVVGDENLHRHQAERISS